MAWGGPLTASGGERPGSRGTLPGAGTSGHQAARRLRGASGQAAAGGSSVSALFWGLGRRPGVWCTAAGMPRLIVVPLYSANPVSLAGSSQPGQAKLSFFKRVEALSTHPFPFNVETANGLRAWKALKDIFASPGCEESARETGLALYKGPTISRGMPAAVHPPPDADRPWKSADPWSRRAAACPEAPRSCRDA